MDQIGRTGALSPTRIPAKPDIRGTFVLTLVFRLGSAFGLVNFFPSLGWGFAPLRGVFAEAQLWLSVAACVTSLTVLRIRLGHPTLGSIHHERVRAGVW